VSARDIYYPCWLTSDDIRNLSLVTYLDQLKN